MTTDTDRRGYPGKGLVVHLLLILALGSVAPAHARQFDCNNLGANDEPGSISKPLSDYLSVPVPDDFSMPCWNLNLHHPDVDVDVYITEEWGPRGPETDVTWFDYPLVESMFESMQHTAKVYSEFGPMPPIDLLLIGENYAGQPIGEAVFSAPQRFRTDGRCTVVIPAIHHLIHGEPIPRNHENFNRLDEKFNQILATQLWRCHNFANLDLWGTQEIQQWWELPAAAFFSNLAWPTVDLEHFAARSYDPRVTLIDQGEAAVSFFQHYNNQVGNDQTYFLLQQIALPDNALDNRTTHLGLLAGVRGIQNAFHAFVQAELDDAIIDTGGKHYPVAKFDVPEESLGERGELSKRVPPFAAVTEQLNLPPGRVYTLSADIPEALKVAYRAENGDWKNGLPIDVDTRCGDTQLQYLVTSTGVVDTNLVIRYESRPAEEGRENCAIEPPDKCLIGHWRSVKPGFTVSSLMHESYAKQGMPSQTVSEEVDIRLDVAEDYSADYRWDEHTVSALKMPGANSKIEIAYSANNKLSITKTGNSHFIQTLSSDQITGWIKISVAGAETRDTIPNNAPQIGTQPFLFSCNPELLDWHVPHPINGKDDPRTFTFERVRD